MNAEKYKIKTIIEIILDKTSKWLSPVVILVQYLKGSPSYPGSHVHLGWCEIVLQDAYVPHTPGQGSTHLFLTQALSSEHSGFIEHSGLHSMYGFPNISGRHVQEAAPFLS